MPFEDLVLCELRSTLSTARRVDDDREDIFQDVLEAFPTFPQLPRPNLARACVCRSIGAGASSDSAPATFWRIIQVYVRLAQQNNGQAQCPHHHPSSTWRIS